MSYFSHVELFPDDPILQLPLLFGQDPRKNKINLGIGAYKDNAGQSFVLSCVREAEKILFEKSLSKDYLPIEGDPTFIQESLKVIFGQILPCGFALQTVGGTSALRLGSEFLRKNGFTDIFVSEPSWPTHQLIFKHAGLNYATYPYFDFKNNRLNFDGMCRSIEQMPARSIILLHACCHNPTGMDPTQEQWKELSFLIKKQNVIPFFDLAYQGFGDSLDDDAFAIRYFIENHPEMFVANSNAKNMGLYGERVGLLAAICNEKVLHAVSSQLKQMARATYSNPPLHGGRIAALIMQSKQLSEMWHQELKQMRLRIKEIRTKLVNDLSQELSQDFAFLNRQKGIFSFLGINHQQVIALREKYGIYMPLNGRINIAGINSSNINDVISALNAVLK